MQKMLQLKRKKLFHLVVVPRLKVYHFNYMIRKKIMSDMLIKLDLSSVQLDNTLFNSIK